MNHEAENLYQQIDPDCHIPLDMRPADVQSKYAGLAAALG